MLGCLKRRMYERKKRTRNSRVCRKKKETPRYLLIPAFAFILIIIFCIIAWRNAQLFIYLFGLGVSILIISLIAALFVILNHNKVTLDEENFYRFYNGAIKSSNEYLELSEIDFYVYAKIIQYIIARMEKLDSESFFIIKVRDLYSKTILSCS